MKRKIHNRLKNGIQILGVLILFFSCQKEDIEIQEPLEQSKAAIFGNLSFNEFANRFDLSTLDQNITSKFKTNLFFQDNMDTYQSFSTDGTNNNYTIDTDLVKTAVFDEKTTFSMKVIRDDPKENTITNIFFEQSSSGEKSYILEFRKDELTGEYQSVAKYDTAYNKIYIASAQVQKDASIIFIDIIYFNCLSGHDSSCQVDCGNCYSSQQFIVWNDSPNTGGSSGDNGSDYSNDYGGGTNTGTVSSGNVLTNHPYFSSGSSTAIGIIDNMTSLSEDIQNAQAFYASLNTDQRVWANSNQFEYVNLMNYLLADYTIPLQDLMRKVITFQKFNPNSTIGFDNSLSENQTIEFNSFSEFENTISNRPTNSVEAIESNDETLEKKRFDFVYTMSPFSDTIRIEVEFVKPEYTACDCIEVDDVSTVQFGNTTFAKWEQIGDYWTEVSQDEEEVKVYIRGLRTTGVNIDGFPFKITNLITYVITLEYSTGYVIEFTSITE